MRLGTAIEHLVEAYKYASDKEWIQDKVAWALYHTWKEADRKDEPSNSEKPNSSTISKMEQVDKDINVRSKDEPQTGEMMTEEEFDSMLARVLTGNNEPQTDCLTCRYNSDEWDSPKCDGCSKADSHYEPQTERSE